jgi:hypothetical protein
MNIWRRSIQTIGAISLALTLWGYYWLIFVAWRELRHPVFNPQVPLFRAAFFTMNAVDAVLLAGMVFAATGMLKLKPEAVAIYSWLILAMIACELGVGALWLLPDPIGRSIAAASGTGSIGSGPLLLFPVPFVYPVLSVILVNLARHKLKVAPQTPLIPKQSDPSD